jgi:F0F1-type ATP synthase epsilon subunit
MLTLRLLKAASGVAKQNVKSVPKQRSPVAKVAKKSVPSFVRLYASDAAVNAAKLKLTLQTPSSSVFLNHECTSVAVPGSVGEFTLSPNSSPAFAELGPGVVRVIEGTSDLKYFVSGGYIASHDDSTVNISVGECVSLQDIDIEAARRIAAASQSKMASATNAEDKAIAQIGFDTATAMVKAYEAK